MPVTPVISCRQRVGSTYLERLIYLIYLIKTQYFIRNINCFGNAAIAAHAASTRSCNRSPTRSYAVILSTTPTTAVSTQFFYMITCSICTSDCFLIVLWRLTCRNGRFRPSIGSFSGLFALVFGGSGLGSVSCLSFGGSLTG